MGGAPLIAIVDDDESVRESLPDLLRTYGFAAQGFASAEAFLGSPAIGNTSCLILDIAMPGMSGADLQQELSRRRLPIPIVFITAHVDDGMRARVLEAGAIACLFKPFSDTALLSAVRAAIPSSNRRGGRANDAIPS